MMDRNAGCFLFRWFPIALLAVAFSILCPAVWAQSEAINGTIRGRVTDPNGAAVPDASITAANAATGYTRTVSTGADGLYVIPALPLGTYTVTVRKEGFATESHPDVVLQAGREAVIDAPLRLGTVATVVEVTGGSPIVESSRVDIGRTIETREVENLPLTSRNPYNFILFQPGVSGHPNNELGIPRTVNTNGLMDRISYQMDGMVDTQSDRYGLRLFPISDVYVREVQTVSNSFAPEFGGTTGSIYNVITGSGSNDLHGMFHFLRRPLSTTARPILLNLAQPKPDLLVNDYAANAGGPLIRNKLFLFGGYEHLRRGAPTAVTINPADAAQLGIPSSLLATAPSIGHIQFFDVRADWNATSHHQVFVRYNYFRQDFPFNTQAGGTTAGAPNALDAAVDFRDRAHVIGSQILSTLSPHLLNEFRFSWPYRKNTHFPNSITGKGPEVIVSGKAVFGGTQSAGDFFAEKTPSFNDNITYTRGAHDFKGGFNAQRILDTQLADVFTAYTFPTIAAYLSAKSGANPFAYSTVQAVLGTPGAHYISFFWGFFLQDRWQLTPSLLLTYGVRYDRFQPPDGDPNAAFLYTRDFRNPAANFAPRLGLAWRLSPKTVVRASSGIFYDAPPTNLWFNSFSTDPKRFLTVSVASNSPSAPPFPQTLTSGVPPSVSTTSVTPGFKNAHTVNASLQISRELSANDAVSIGYVFTGGRQLLFLHNINLINPTGFLADGRPIFSSTINAQTRLFPQFALGSGQAVPVNNVNLQDVGANSNYHALLLNYQHRWSHGLQTSASYTFSHTITDAPEVNAFEQNLPIEDPTNRRRDRGNSSVNRPQALTLSAVFEPQARMDNPALRRLFNDNQFTVLVNALSGDAQNVRANRVLNGDATTSAVVRPLFFGRNTVRGPRIFQMDVRYTRTILSIRERVRPQFFAEANNLFNDKNVAVLNTVVPVDAQGAAILPSSFPKTSSTFLEGRILQFGVAVRW